MPSPSKSAVVNAVNADCADGAEVGESETAAADDGAESGEGADEVGDEADKADEDEVVLEHAAAVRPSAAIPPRRRNDRRSAVTPRVGSEDGALMANIQHRIRKRHPPPR
ncbi:MAG: hypothetical protein ABI706_14240 [Ilumatobacteraceae bacterium]